MKKLSVIFLICCITFCSCGRSVYLNESKKIAISKKKHASSKKRGNSDVLIAFLIAIPNIAFFGNALSNGK